MRFYKLTVIAIWLGTAYLGIFASDHDDKKALLDSEEMRDYGTRSTGGHLDQSTASEAVRILDDDYRYNVKTLVNERRFFRLSAGCNEVFANIFGYLGMGLTLISGGIHWTGSTQIGNWVLFSSTVCIALHGVLIGLAKCSAKEENAREKLLDALAEEVGFKVVAMTPEIIDDSDNASQIGKQPTNGKHKK